MKTAEELLKEKPAIFTPAGRCVRIEDAESAMHEFASQSRWIAVEDRLPPNYDDVLIYNGHDVFIAFHNEIRKVWECDYIGIIHEVSHWQPLPQPPKQ